MILLNYRDFSFNAGTVQVNPEPYTLHCKINLQKMFSGTVACFTLTIPEHVCKSSVSASVNDL